MTMPDVPYWTIPRYDGTRIVPWSGEVVVEPVPTQPINIPLAGPVLRFIGTGEHAIWNNVWSWIKNTAVAGVEDAFNVETETIDGVATLTIRGAVGVSSDIANALTTAVRVVENYVGAHLQAMSSLVNDLSNYAQAVGQTVVIDISYVWGLLDGEIRGIEGRIEGLAIDVAHIDNLVIPGLETEIRGIEAAIPVWAEGALNDAKVWAIDNIYTPLDAEIKKVEATIPVWAEGAFTDAKNYADNLVHNEALQRAAAIAGIAAAVTTITSWIDDCGEPMCQYAGPNTDLGKLLKGLKVAAEIAALTAILNMTEQDLANFITTITQHLAGVVGDVEQFLSPGGETVAGLIAHATSDLA